MLDMMRSRVTTCAVAFSAALSSAAVMIPARDARACGCFAPPDPSVPVVQAGERIVFSHEDGVVTAHIQIQYQGEASEFGWILPLPSIPDMKLGTEEIFTQLINATQPKYRLNRIVGEQCNWGNVFAASANDSAGRSEGGAPPMEPDSVVVIQDSIGPFDYAVLRADTRNEMFDWLAENRYFIPAGTEDIVGPYIHEGAYFLALKLRKGNDAGDIQPVVLRYESDLPMIPIILTSVAANPDMGIQVWVLGESRAIPRNYRHTVINEEYLDWFSAGQNYNDVIVRATNEAPDGQSFVTEFAGSSQAMVDTLDWQGRFGRRADLELITDAAVYVGQLRANGFPWTSSLVAALKRTFPMPERVRQEGISEEEYYNALDYYIGSFRDSRPELFQGYDFAFDPRALTTELWERIVEPTLEAGQLFRDNSKMTRLYTTLSPEEMTKDPVFSFNPSLPDVDNVHEATFTYLCGAIQDGPNNTPGIIELPDGRRFYVEKESAWQDRDRSGVPYSRRIEFLREEGAPEIEVDNSTRVTPGDPSGGSCACRDLGAKSAGEGLAWSALALVALGGIGLRRRRR